MQAYNVAGFNYFRARDIFSALNLSIEPSGNGISVNSTKPYTASNVLPPATNKNVTVNLFSAPLYYDDNSFKATCFNIEGYNYFRLQDLSLASFQAASNKINKVNQAAYNNNQSPDLATVYSFSLDYNKESNTIIINNLPYKLNEFYDQTKEISTINIPTDKPFKFTYVDDEKSVPITFANNPYVKGKNFMVPFEDLAKAMGVQFEVSGDLYNIKQVVSSKTISDMYSTINISNGELKTIYTNHSGYKNEVTRVFDILPEFKNGQLFVPLDMLTLATETLATIDVNNYTVKIDYYGMGIGTSPGAQTVRFVANEQSSTTEENQNSTNNEQNNSMSDVTIQVGGKTVKVGDLEQDIIKTFGNPDRKDNISNNYTWYVYNKDYNNFIMIAIKDNKVIGYATNAKTFSVNNGLISEGSQTNEELSKKITILIDKLDNNKVRGIYYCDIPLDNKTDINNNFKAQELINADFVNAFRVTMGKNSLAFVQNLSDVARLHSQDMADNNYFDHTNLQGKDPFDRMENAGISFYAAGENIASTFSPNGISAFEMWLNSEGHRKNMLVDDFKEIGVGMGYNGGNFMYTQIFKG